jgi:hypothetical protein
VCGEIIFYYYFSIKKIAEKVKKYFLFFQVNEKLFILKNLIRFFIFLSYSDSRFKILENLFILGVLSGLLLSRIKNFLNTKKENGHNLLCIAPFKT